MRVLPIRTRLTMAHALMVLAALVAFVATTRVLEDRGRRVDVVVAAVPLGRGEPIDAGRAGLATISIAAGTLDGSLVGPAEVPSGVLVRDISPGEPLLRSDVLPALDGVRALALPVDPEQIAGLGLREGDVVDVIGFVGSDGPSLVANGLRVVRLPAADASAAFGTVTGGGFVTVEVTTDQAIALVAALDAGRGGGNGRLQLVRATGAPPLATESIGVRP